MYCRKTKTRVINSVDHFTYSIVESRRNENHKVKQHILLNLGAHYDITPEKSDHSYLLKEYLVLYNASTIPIVS